MQNLLEADAFRHKFRPVARLRRRRRTRDGRGHLPESHGQIVRPLRHWRAKERGIRLRSNDNGALESVRFSWLRGVKARQPAGRCPLENLNKFSNVSVRRNDERSPASATRSDRFVSRPRTAPAMSSYSTISVHKQPKVRVAIEQAGASLRFLPPYSPDFNPIEQAFAKLKAFFRAARPRSFDDVCELMATAIALFMPDECANYVRHCGYRVTT